MSIVSKVAHVTEFIVSSLYQHLQMPIQHIADIKKMMEEYSQYVLSSNPDYESLKSALAKLAQVADEIKERVNLEDILNIQRKFSGGVPKLPTFGRFLIRQGDLVNNSKVNKWKNYYF